MANNKKRIVFFQDTLNCGGTESALYDLINLLDRDKFEITIFVFREGGELEEKFKKLDINIVSAWSGVKPIKGIIGKVVNKLKLLDIDYQIRKKRKPWKYSLSGHYDLAISYLVEPKWGGRCVYLLEDVRL